MSAMASQNKVDFVRLAPVAAPSPWQAAVLPLSSFPVPEAELGPVRILLQKLVRAFATEGSTLETFVDFANLHLADGAAHLSKHGRHWIPAMGMGVWPDREPPTGWTVEDFQQMVPGEKLRPLINIALRITGPAEARHHARDILLGRGVIVHMLTDSGGDQMIETARNLLLPPIKDPSMTGFPFYIPLLEAKSIGAATAPRLDAWCCGAHTYIRESVEDRGILILSRSLEDILRGLGCVLSSAEPREWQVPEELHVPS